MNIYAKLHGLFLGKSYLPEHHFANQNSGRRIGTLARILYKNTNPQKYGKQAKYGHTSYNINYSFFELAKDLSKFNRVIYGHLVYISI